MAEVSRQRALLAKEQTEKEMQLTQKKLEDITAARAELALHVAKLSKDLKDGRPSVLPLSPISNQQTDAKANGESGDKAQAFLAELRKKYPEARLVGTTTAGTIYCLGPASEVGRKNHMDEAGVRYELLLGGVL